MEPEMEKTLEMKNIIKEFPGTTAVNQVDFCAQKGEVHSVCGENGAGKSTLMKILAGEYNDYSGEIKINGDPVKLFSPNTSKDCGIAIIHQELSLAQPISIAENILAGRLPKKLGFILDKRKVSEITRHYLKRVGLEYLDPFIEVSAISQHEAQLVEVAKALVGNPSILIMDEPTSALSNAEVKRLFEIVDGLKKQGLAIIYISHHLQEVFQVSDKITVMRDGKKIGTYAAKETCPERIIELMVGRQVAEFYKKEEIKTGNNIIDIKGLSRFGFFRDVSLKIQEGEVVGICGLAGSGRSELAKSICGIDPFDEGDNRVLR